MKTKHAKDINFIELKRKQVSKSLIFPAKSTTEFVITDFNGEQQSFVFIDLEHMKPLSKGKGTAKVTWSTYLKWTVDIYGNKEWRKVLTVTNKSRSKQHLQLFLKRMSA